MKVLQLYYFDADLLNNWILSTNNPRRYLNVVVVFPLQPVPATTVNGFDITLCSILTQKWIVSLRSKKNYSIFHLGTQRPKSYFVFNVHLWIRRRCVVSLIYTVTKIESKYIELVDMIVVRFDLLLAQISIWSILKPGMETVSHFVFY